MINKLLNILTSHKDFVKRYICMDDYVLGFNNNVELATTAYNAFRAVLNLHSVTLPDLSLQSLDSFDIGLNESLYENYVSPYLLFNLNNISKFNRLNQPLKNLYGGYVFLSWVLFLMEKYKNPTIDFNHLSGNLDNDICYMHSLLHKNKDNIWNLKNSWFHENTTNFILTEIKNDLLSGKNSHIITRFPPEPNGYLHLGHAKSIWLNFGIANLFNGQCNLRFDDTNPDKENEQFIESIIEDVKWLGGDWKTNLFFASSYFDQLYSWAIQLIKQGDAYVDNQTEEEVRINRGSLLESGVESKFRNRSVIENLELFEKMKSGHFPEGACILRAKIDMSHGNLNMRDPPLYRIKTAFHPRTGASWNIYPFYDFAHGQCDSIENITHSICTTEFETHRLLYEWLQEKLNIKKTRQIEFARLNCEYIITSKSEENIRKLKYFVDTGIVNGWDDPRLPTLSGLRRRGIPPEAIIDFCNRVGVAKRENLIKYSLLNACTVNTLNKLAVRRFVIVNPLPVEILNFGAEEIIELNFKNHPNDPLCGSRKGTFTKHIYIDRNDFCLTPAQNYHRLAPNQEVRLRYGYYIKCVDYQLDTLGNVSKVFCTVDLSTKGGNPPLDNRKVKGTIHWLSALNFIMIKLHLYDHLISVANAEKFSLQNITDVLNKHSLEVKNAFAEKNLQFALHPYKGGKFYQFERVGYFVADYSSTIENPVFNLTAKIPDSWTK